MKHSHLYTPHLSEAAKRLLTFLPPASNPHGAPLLLLAKDLEMSTAEMLQPVIRELRNANYELQLARSPAGQWCLSVKPCSWTRAQVTATHYLKQEAE